MKVGKFLKGVVQFVGRVVDNFATGGLIHNIVEEVAIKTKVGTVLKTSDKGKVDYPKWFAMIIITLPLWFMIAVKMGWITLEEADWLLEHSPKTK